jgi:hypothetical protein
MYKEIPSNRVRQVGAIDPAVNVIREHVIPLFNIDVFLDSAATHSMIVEDDETAAIYRCPKAGNIQDIGYWCQSVVTIGGNPTVSFRLETVSAAAGAAKHPTPSGTLWGVGTIKSVTPPKTGWNWVKLGTAGAVSVGDEIAVVARAGRGTGLTKYARLYRGANSHAAIFRGYPFPLIYEAGGIES